jgi:hypothetical protein
MFMLPAKLFACNLFRSVYKFVCLGRESELNFGKKKPAEGVFRPEKKNGFGKKYREVNLWDARNSRKCNFSKVEGKVLKVMSARSTTKLSIHAKFPITIGRSSSSESSERVSPNLPGREREDAGVTARRAESSGGVFP